MAKFYEPKKIRTIFIEFVFFYLIIGLNFISKSWVFSSGLVFRLTELQPDPNTRNRFEPKLNRNPAESDILYLMYCHNCALDCIMKVSKKGCQHFIVTKNTIVLLSSQVQTEESCEDSYTFSIKYNLNTDVISNSYCRYAILLSSKRIMTVHIHATI